MPTSRDLLVLLSRVDTSIDRGGGEARSYWQAKQFPLKHNGRQSCCCCCCSCWAFNAAAEKSCPPCPIIKATGDLLSLVLEIHVHFNANDSNSKSSFGCSHEGQGNPIAELATDKATGHRSSCPDKESFSHC